MKNLLKLTTLLLILIVSITNAETIRYDDHLSKHGFSLSRSATNGVVVNHSISEFSIDEVKINNITRKVVTLPGVFLQNDAGMPNLPGSSRYIALPQGATASFNIVSFRKELIKNVDVGPAPIIPLDTEDEMTYEENISVYSSNSNYPKEIIKLSEVKKIRGLDVVMLGITPYEYNPVTKDLTVYRDIQVEISFHGGNGHFGEDRLRDRDWDKILKNTVINRSALKYVDYKINSNSKTDDFKYIIIVPDDATFISYANQLRDFRIKQGIRTGVVTMTEIGSNTVSAITTYISNAYNNWDLPPAAVLLMADFDDITAPDYPHPYSGTYVTDNDYADVDGDDIPEIIFARMTAQNESHLATMVDKVINYELNPPTDTNFYNKPITALGFQLERWFQICSEAVGGYLSNVEGKDVTRINELYNGSSTTSWSTATNTSQVINYFGPSGEGYLPATPAELGGWSGGNSTDISNAINSGSFMLQHRDHGAPTGWGEPSYWNSNIDELSNVDYKLPFIFSINCSTGQFNMSGESFAEKFHRYTYNNQSSGALGLIAATQVSYSFVNDTFVWGMFDFMYPNFMPDYGTSPTANDPFYPSFGMVNGKIFLESSSWPYNTGSKQITYRLFHHHSDAYLTVFSEVPQNLTLTYPSSIISTSSAIDITADLGAIVAFTVGNEIIGTGVGTGSNQSISIVQQAPGTDITLTVTKQNFFRHQETITVITSTTPYLSFSSSTINDTGGNNNGIIDYGESINLGVTIENIGAITSTGITAVLSTTSPLVSSIPINSASHSSLSAGSSTLLSTEYEINFNNEIEDQTEIEFLLTMTDASKQVTTSNFNLLVNAPKIEYSYTMIPSVSIEPGDTRSFDFTVTNNGHSSANGISADLTITGVFSEITETTSIASSLAIGAVSHNEYSVAFDDLTPHGTTAFFDLNVTGDKDIDTHYLISEVIGGPENFESGVFPPVGWSNYILGDGPGWIETTSKSNSPTHSIFHDDDQVANNCIDWFVLPMKTLSNGASISFYEENTYVPSYYEHHGLWISTGSGNPADGDFVLITEFDEDSDGFIERVVDLSGYSGECYLAFKYTGDYMSEWWIDDILVSGLTASGIYDYEKLPLNTTLYQNYPNPFNPETTIKYYLVNNAKVDLVIYNAKGEQVYNTGLKNVLAGKHTITFDGSSLNSGVYFYNLIVNGKNIQNKKMLLVK